MCQKNDAENNQSLIPFMDWNLPDFEERESISLDLPTLLLRKYNICMVPGSKLFYKNNLFASESIKKGLFLITGEGDLTGLALEIARYYINISSEKLLYLRADYYPEYSPFLKLLEKELQNKIPIPNPSLNPNQSPFLNPFSNQFPNQSLFSNQSPFPNQSLFSNQFPNLISHSIKYFFTVQYWPPDFSGVPPQKSFGWLIISSRKSIWKKWADEVTERKSILEEHLEVYAKPNGEHFTSIILEGEFCLEPSADFCATLHRLKDQNKTVIVVVPSISKKNLHNVHWDTIINVKKWRSYRCGDHRLIANIQRLGRQERYNLKYEEDRHCWMLHRDKRDLLREPVKHLMDIGFTAKKILEIINKQYQFDKPLTAASLAALKRFWNFRTYKPEKRPRGRRNIQPEQPETSSQLSSDETI